MRSAVYAGLVTSSPCDGVQMPRIELMEMRFLPPPIGRLAEAMDPRYRAVVLLAAYGGLRAGELFGLRAKRFDILRRQVAIAEAIVDVGGHLISGLPRLGRGTAQSHSPGSLRTSVSGDEEVLNDWLDALALRGRMADASDDPARSCVKKPEKKPDSFAAWRASRTRSKKSSTTRKAVNRTY